MPRKQSFLSCKRRSTDDWALGQVAAMVAEAPELFSELIAGCGRKSAGANAAADAAEKSRGRKASYSSLQGELLGLMAETEQQNAMASAAMVRGWRSTQATRSRDCLLVDIWKTAAPL